MFADQASLVGKSVKDKRGEYHGVGRILAVELFSGCYMYAVDFAEEGIVKRRFDEVEFIKSIPDKLYEGTHNLNDFELRVKASLLLNDNLRTGSLYRMKIDLLPHQIIIAGRVINTNASGFLIADDPGLGKTIEAGLAMRYLIAHGRASRILLICPAGLTYQWREQMDNRFNEYFDIFNEEMIITNPEKWDRSPRVIASIESLRLDRHKDKLINAAQGWDLVIVDEAHHLTATQYNVKIAKTENYQLAEELRKKTKFFLFLTATPHQGDDSRFAMLLKLLDPSIVRRVEDLDQLGERVNDLIGRNLKSAVTDFNRRPLFKGHDVIPHKVKPSDEYGRVIEDLNKYVREGLTMLDGQSNRSKGTENFVLTSLLKLAASSPSALRNTLLNRSRNLRNDEFYMPNPDGRFEGENEERKVAATREIFTGETDIIRDIVGKLGGVVDPKLDELDKILEADGFNRDTDKRMLIFTEYRGTQEEISKHLSKKYGSELVAEINGDLKTLEKRKAISVFESTARFLVSTEAGGEGLDLHKRCHVMVNFDIPWNPMRLHQRIGRLDRYGQQQRVQAHYIVVDGTIDDKIQKFLDEKIARIERRMGDLKGDSGKDLRKDILGFLPVSRDSLSRMYVEGDETSEENINANLDEAYNALKRQEDLLRKIKGFDLSEIENVKSEYSLADLEALIGEYLKTKHKRMMKDENGVVHFEIPDEIMKLGQFDGRKLIDSQIRGTFSRKPDTEKNIVVLGVGNEYIDAMLYRMTRNTDTGDVVAVRMFIEPSKLPGIRKMLMASFAIVSTSTSGTRPSFDGFEFNFYSPEDGRLIEDPQEARVLLDVLLNRKSFEVISSAGLPRREDVDEWLRVISNHVNSKSRHGRIGSIDLNCLAWLEISAAK